MVSFKDKVLDIVKTIPKGKVLSYKQVANLADSPNAMRAVGNITMRNTDLSVPCHRVIKSDGSIGEYNGLRNNEYGSTGKIKILKQEGVKFDKNEKVILEN